MFHIFVLAYCVLSVSATIFIKGPCPSLKGVDNFNITAYASGKWFEIARYPNDWENRGNCVSKVFNPEGSNYKFRLTDVVDHSQTYYDGRIELAPEAGNTGLLNYISTAYEGSEGENKVPVYILDIDHDNYSIGYECKYDPTKDMRHDFAWVMSRSKSLQGKTKTKVDNFIKSSNLIDPSKLIWVDFTEDACK
ncbi:bilin-binding protein-like [Aricia agestis]|uniref:bilin-binding protein-like n=1 Tax=Aricia agestis TaxID=91739 RepID=UPI001C20A41F|nr:bilin-binding protein-like [Aricia agestis]